jgi:hypothetical protein
MPSATTAKTPARLTIMDAALRLRLSYDVVRRMVLVGELEGGKGDTGRWYVEASSVEAYRRNSATETAAS